MIGVDAYGFVEDCDVTGSNNTGVYVDAGDADVIGCRLAQNFIGAGAGLGGTVQIFDSELTENEIGVAAATEGAARIAGATIVGSGTGVLASESATVTIGGATIRDTRGPGIDVRRLGYVDIQDALIVDGGAEGVLVQQSSAIRFRNSTIRGNQGDGISLLDLSIGTGPEGLPGDVQQIVDNGGWAPLVERSRARGGRLRTRRGRGTQRRTVRAASCRRRPDVQPARRVSSAGRS